MKWYFQEIFMILTKTLSLIFLQKCTIVFLRYDETSKKKEKSSWGWALLGISNERNKKIKKNSKFKLNSNTAEMDIDKI